MSLKPVDWIHELSREQSARTAYLQLVREGLPVVAVDQLAKRLAPSDPRFKYKIVSESTYRRRRKLDKANDRLSPEQSEKTARLTRILSYATEVFGSEDIARQFLNKPHIELGKETPLNCAMNGESGGVAVEHLLGRIKFGSAA